MRELGVPRWDIRDNERTVAMLRRELGDMAFEAWREGTALHEDEAVLLAASCLD